MSDGLGVKAVREWCAKQIEFRITFSVDGERREQTTYAENVTAAKAKPKAWFPGQRVRILKVKVVDKLHGGA